MMIEDRFQAMAALRGWTTETKLSVLLDYIGLQLFCLDTFDLFTPDEAAAEWRRRRQT